MQRKGEARRTESRCPATENEEKNSRARDILVFVECCAARNRSEPTVSIATVPCQSKFRSDSVLRWYGDERSTGLAFSCSFRRRRRRHLRPSTASRRRRRRRSRCADVARQRPANACVRASYASSDVRALVGIHWMIVFAICCACRFPLVPCVSFSNAIEKICE